MSWACGGLVRPLSSTCFCLWAGVWLMAHAIPCCALSPVHLVAQALAHHGASLRRAAVAQWEVRLRVPDASGAWRLVISTPTGACLLVSFPGLRMHPACDQCKRCIVALAGAVAAVVCRRYQC